MSIVIIVPFKLICYSNHLGCFSQFSTFQSYYYVWTKDYQPFHLCSPTNHFPLNCNISPLTILPLVNQFLLNKVCSICNVDLNSVFLLWHVLADRTSSFFYEIYALQIFCSSWFFIGYIGFNCWLMQWILI